MKITPERLAVAALLLIVIFSAFYMRSANSVPDKMLSYDPIFQYRFTKYYVDFGELPLWDELSYYTGRAVSTSAPGLIFYLTALIYSFVKGLGWSLVTAATFASAWYGALIAVPAFLLGRELSNKWGGLFGAALTASAPQILVRTFGSSFDTDQLAIFFILLTLWAGFYALKKRDVFSVALASACFVLFASAWQTFWYTFFFLAAGSVAYLSVEYFMGWRKQDGERAKAVVNEGKKLAVVLAAMFITISACAYALNIDPIANFFGVIGFAQEAEKQIVNISIAELQLINIADLSTWITAIGNFSIGYAALDNIFFLALISLMLYGVAHSYKNDRMTFSMLLTILLISVYTITRGIRFTEFSSGLLIAVAAAGFGRLTMAMKGKELFVKGFVAGLGLFLAAFAIFNGIYIGQHLGPDNDSNWMDAWTYLRTQTPELSLVGTWWDPGHMITGLADRRVIADGAHCGSQCLYGINDRITSLGKIMATSDENVSLGLINKYRGDSPAVYWIASNDLISKYQWLQYFGLGCNPNTDSSCQLYSLVNLQSMKYDQTGKPIVKIYGPLILLDVGSSPVIIYTQGKNAAFLGEVLYYDGNDVRDQRMENANMTSLVQDLTPLVTQLGYRMTNQTVPVTAWVSKDSSYMVIIPSSLRNTVFTRMFFMEGQGLEHFKQVFRNEEVKIYEVEP